MDAFLKVRDKIEELRNRGGAETLSRANLYARTFGIDEDALVSGRMAIFKKAWLEEAKRNEGIAAEKAVALTRAYNALAAALETVSRKADSALFDKFGAVLDRLTKWLDEDSGRIVKFFTDLVTQIGLVFTDLGKLRPAFVFLWDALKEVGSWLQKVIGQPDSSGLAGVRHLLELISGVVMARVVASMAAGFIAAFAPLTALLAGLAALGIIGVGAYTAGEAVRGWFEGGSGAGEGMESGGRGAARRGRMGYRGSPRGERAIRASRADVSADAAMIRKAAIDAGVDPDIAVAVAKSEGLGTSYAGGDYGSSFGPFQMHFGGMAGGSNRGAGLGDAMLRETGIDARDPKNKEAVVKWALKYAKVHGWGDWNGAARIGIGSRQGLDYTPRPVVAAKPSVRPSIPNPFAHWDPNFDQKLNLFKDAKPLGSDQHSMNEIYDCRAVTNDVNIHIAGQVAGEKD